MVTTLSLMFVLWHPQPPCVGCGGASGGGFPIASDYGHGHFDISHAWNYCKGEVWSLQPSKGVATLGTFAPNGDPWAMNMQRMPGSATVPVTAPAPAADTKPAAPPADPGQAPAPAPAMDRDPGPSPFEP
jgi:hypothetical protein